MAFVARQGDPTTTGGVVISGSDTSFIEGQRVARVTDTVWCPMCQTVGFIIEGHDTWLDTRQPTAVDGSLVQCGCPTGTHRLVATQKSTLSEDQPPIPIHPEWLPLGVANSQRWAEAIQEDGHRMNSRTLYPASRPAGCVSRVQKSSRNCAPCSPTTKAWSRAFISSSRR